MLFMVMSTPRPERPSDMRSRQAAFWDWLEPKKATGECHAAYVKAGRGAMIVFDVDSHETLHRLMTEWAEFIPAEFAVWPLVTPGHQEAIARKG